MSLDGGGGGVQGPVAFITDPLNCSSSGNASAVLSSTFSPVGVSVGAAVVKREPLRYIFKGYSLWLHVEEDQNDITDAIQTLADKWGVLPIPASHVTAFYGMDHLTEAQARTLFHEQVKGEAGFRDWPDFDRPVGMLVDVELEGVKGGSMDMAWAELTLSTTPQHEAYLDRLYSIFYPANEHHAPRKSPWRPHLSLAYDNPEHTILSLPQAAQVVLAQYPSLLEKKTRKIVGIGLWKTEGRMEDWTCLDRIDF